MINFNEKRYVKENILRPYGKIKDANELLMFIRYYNDMEFEYDEIYRMVQRKVDRTESVYLTAENEHMYKAYYMRAIQRKQYANEPVEITKSEYDWIRQVGNIEKEKILFSLFVIQKFLNLEFVRITYKYLRDHSLSKKQAGPMREEIEELKKDGFVKQISDKTYQVLIPDFDDTEPYLKITDYNHIPAPYLRTLRTDDFFYCEWCGKKIKYSEEDKKSNYNRVFCSKCAEIKHKTRKKS